MDNPETLATMEEDKQAQDINTNQKIKKIV